MKDVKKPNPVDVHVGGRIRMRRNMLGMSQEKLGESLGVTFQQVQKYEKGTNRVGASRLQDIASVLNTPVSYFFENAPSRESRSMPVRAEESENVSAIEFSTTAEGLSLNRAFVKIASGKTRRRIIDLVRTLAEEDGEA
ncbi:MAG: helix-turn-helix transcriptional regulator [Rhizobiales bacterium]|nr:helix-turn-helix transcriptional regulator [Hyphomicrobiales bacterium]